MFQISAPELRGILRDYGITYEIQNIEELLRYHYEKRDPESKQVRVIVKATLESGAVVVKFKREREVTKQILERQCAFSNRLMTEGIATARYYARRGDFVCEYEIGGYDVLVTVEDFCAGELKLIDAEIAEKLGKLLADMHDISERNELRVDFNVLFNPLERNELCAPEEFAGLREKFDGEDAARFDRIISAYHMRLAKLEPLRAREKYAVQGDLSDCNLYMTETGEIGVFDFNNCGDNYLFADAVMQAVFVSRLMDYGEPATEAFSKKLLCAFLRGYESKRPFTPEERAMCRELLIIVDTFWNMDLLYDDNSLINMLKRGDADGASAFLVQMERRIS